jgi:hypothetical protein
MSQPIWKFVVNLGDTDPIENGGYFVFTDETGVYPPEVELLEEPAEDSKTWTVYRFVLENCTFASDIEPPARYYFTKAELKVAKRKAMDHGTVPYNDMVTAHLMIQYKRPVTYDVNRGWYITRQKGEFLDSPGILSDNPSHPTNAVWFDKYLEEIADTLNMELEDLVLMFVGDDPVERAMAWREVAQHWGPHELDSYPITLTKREAKARYKDILAGKDCCEKCDEPLDKDCQGKPRCPICDEPCPDCFDGGEPSV